MTSPLLTYVNAWLLISVSGAPSIVGGRVTTTAGTYRIVQCYLKRQQSSGTSTGADYIFSQTASNLRTGSAGGSVYLYRGYALRYATLTTQPNFSTLDVNGLTYIDFDLPSSPEWMVNGSSGQHRQGGEKPAYFEFEFVGGKFGDAGIDQIINNSIEGIPIVVRSGQVLN